LKSKHENGEKDRDLAKSNVEAVFGLHKVTLLPKTVAQAAPGIHH
jgi:hypothetical protein